MIKIASKIPQYTLSSKFIKKAQTTVIKTISRPTAAVSLAGTGILISNNWLNKKRNTVNIPQSEQIMELSDDNFKLKQIALEREMALKAPNVYEIIASKHLNKYNIQLMEKFIKEDKFYNNESLFNSFSNAFAHVHTKNLAQKKLDIMNKFLKEKELSSNPNIIEHLGVLLGNINDEESPETSLILRFMQDENLYKNENISKNIFRIIAKCSVIDNFLGHANNNEQYEIVNKILDNPELIKNKKFVDSIADYLTKIFLETGASYRSQFVKQFINDKRIYKNDALTKNFDKFLLSIHNKESLNSKLLVLNKFIETDELNQNSDVVSIFPKLLEWVSRKEQAGVALKVLGDENLYKNKIILSSLVEIIKSVSYNKSYDSAMQFFDTEELYNNPTLVMDLPTLLDFNLKVKGHEFLNDLLFNKKNLTRFLTFQNDAIKNRNLLKTGLLDLSDKEILESTASYNSVKALDILGKKTLEASFPMTITGLEDICEDIATMELDSYDEELLLQKINPLKSMEYRNLKEELRDLKKELHNLVGESNHVKIQQLVHEKDKVDAIKLELSKKLKQQEPKSFEYKTLKSEFKEYYNESKRLGSQIQTLYFNNENSKQIKYVMKDIATLAKELNSLITFSTKLSPQEILEKVRVISGLSGDGNVRSFIGLIKEPTPENNQAWDNALHEKIYQKMDLPYDSEIAEKLGLLECKYLSKMFVSNDEFFYNMGTLVKRVAENKDKSIEEIFDNLPQNKKTQKLFSDYGINYEKWTKYDPTSYVKVDYVNKLGSLKSNAVKTLERYINQFVTSDLPEDIIEELYENLQNIGITVVQTISNPNEIELANIREVDDIETYINEDFSRCYLLHGNDVITFDDLSKISSCIKKTINSNEFWTVANSDKEIDKTRVEIYEKLIKELPTVISNATKESEEQFQNMLVRKVNMYDIKSSIALGNDAQCCTALGRNFKEFTAPTYIMNKCLGAIELVDNGNAVGNSMVYFATVDGKLSLIFDNIELKEPYRNNIEIRKAFVDYAKKLCEEVGQPDIPIYNTSERNKLDMKIYPYEKHAMKIIGSSGNDAVYLDYDADMHLIDGDETPKILMYRLR